MKKIFLFICLLFLPLFFLSADEEHPAILVRGPLPHDGIEYLGVNAISSQYGEYLYEDDSVPVYFTTEEIFLSSDWIKSDCGIEGLYKFDKSADNTIAAYVDRKGWTAFLSFKQEAAYICEFIEEYRGRQNYFLNIAREDIGFSFPALLEFSQGE
ncbi:MAG TPA: hypothetical protein DCO79_05065 [Spirochaeta sp.]|nr:hypothetical protein [Spirochaeta sp.]